MSRRTASAAGRRVVLAHVEVAVAVELDDPRQAGREVGGELVVVDRLGGGDEEDRASRRRRGACRSRTRRSRRRSRGRGSRPRRRPRGAPAGRSTGPSRPAGSRCPCSARSSRRCRKSARRAPCRPRGSARRRATGAPRSRAAARPPRPPAGSSSSAASSAAAAPGAQLGVLVEQQAVARPSPRASRVESFSALPARRSSSIRRMSPPQRPHRLGRAVVGGVVEDEDLALDAGRVGALDRLQAGEQVLAAVRVHDAVGERGRHRPR